MFNILLTDYCNRNCPYCFAKKRIENTTINKRWELSMDELEIILRYRGQRRDIPVSLLGGEPTLHTKFPQIVARILEGGYGVKIFSNGVTPYIRELKNEVPIDDVSVIVNLNAPETYTAEEMKELELNFQALTNRICLSFNIFRPDFTWDNLRNAILTWNLLPNIRLGGAQPIQGLYNDFLRENDMKEASERIVTMATDFARDGITIGFDCGFRLCDFTDQQLGKLAECGTAFNFACGPALDIGENLEVWRCFPFSGRKGVTLTDFETIEEIRNHFNEEWVKYKDVGNKPACSGCKQFRNGMCAKGCLSRTITYEQSKTRE